MLALEDISDLELLDTAIDVSVWSHDRIEAVIRGLGELHAVWYGREEDLLHQPWLGPVLTASRREDMRPLWHALAAHATQRLAAGNGHGLRLMQARLLEKIGPRWCALDAMPRTLIHNDFNPRNVALRREGSDWRLCAYDWELATVGVPQHDCAEFLCFVLGKEVDPEIVRHYIELHRRALERAAQRPVSAETWEIGFRLALHDLLVDRLAMYAMIDRFRPQRFLPRVVDTWERLYSCFPCENGGAT